jgi:hypothetical protein
MAFFTIPTTITDATLTESRFFYLRSVPRPPVNYLTGSSFLVRASPFAGKRNSIIYSDVLKNRVVVTMLTVAGGVKNSRVTMREGCAFVDIHYGPIVPVRRTEEVSVVYRMLRAGRAEIINESPPTNTSLSLFLSRKLPTNKASPKLYKYKCHWQSNNPD